MKRREGHFFFAYSNSYSNTWQHVAALLQWPACALDENVFLTGDEQRDILLPLRRLQEDQRQCAIKKCDIFVFSFNNLFTTQLLLHCYYIN